MSRLICKEGITIGEISAKKNYTKNLTAIVFKVFHKGLGSNEDHFVFYEDTESEDWYINLEDSLISLSHRTNHRLIKEVYSNFTPTEPLNIQEFTDLLYDEHFQIFVDANAPTENERRGLLGWFMKLFGKSKS